MMRASVIFSVCAALATFAAAAPTVSSRDVTTPFYLVTTTSSKFNSNSSLLSNVSATSLFDPYYQANYFLRLIGPGYGGLPTFNLTDGTLHTAASGPHGFPASEEFNSTYVEAGTELQFSGSPEPKGNLGIKQHLLTVNGKKKGWTICDGDLEQQVVSLGIKAEDKRHADSLRQVEWKGTDASCTPTYIQAVAKPPY